MTTVTLKALHLYDARALFLGFRNEQAYITGFVNERTLSEGIKREGYKIARILGDEIDLINEQRKVIAQYTEEGVDAEGLKLIREEKEQQLLGSEVKIAFEPIAFSKVKDHTLTDNYQFLYDKFFE